jgi:glycosyltransferase involved in cell wall biosynthesis
VSRIAFYAPLKPPDHPVPSGDRTMGRMLVAALELGGHQVAVASRFRSFDAGDAARQARLREVGERLAERLLRRFEAGQPPELWFTYHLYHKAPDWLGPAVTERLGIPYFVAEASFAPKQAGGRWDLGHRGAAGAIRRADRLFQINPVDAECLRPLAASPERLVPLPPFLDLTPFRTAAGAQSRAQARAESAEQFGLPGEEPWLLTVAMMRKDQKLRSYQCLAAALAELNDQTWRLIIAGTGAAESEVRAAFAPFGGRVRWIGELDRASLHRSYRSADLFVWPAIKEAFGMALLEAQACGLPVVAGRSGGVATIVRHGETGLLAEEGDASAFAAAVKTLLDDAGARIRMSAAALASTAREHDIGVAAALLDAHIRAATGAPRR